MTITLSSRAEKYVREVMATSRCETPEATLDFILEVREADDLMDRQGLSMAEKQIEQALLASIDSPTTPWRGKEEVEEILAEARARHEAGKG